MKKALLLLAFLCTLPNLIQAQKTYVPDDIFENYLIGKGWDDVLDDSVITANISGRTYLDISYKSINDLTGIEDFLALQILHCENNNISSLDISNASVLRQLYCANNSLSSLDLSNNSALQLLSCYNNNIAGLNLNQNTALQNVNCYNNELETISVSGATKLEVFMCDANKITILDLSQNTALITVSCTSNQLIKLDARNGENSRITTFNATSNPNLSCIEVDNAEAANNGDTPYNYWSKDVTATYSEDCVLPRTYVPDDNFEQALIDLGYDNEIDDYVTTFIISSVSSLNVSGKNIADLTGIEEFSDLGQLNCSNNLLTNLDISQNTLLTYLNCSNNLLTYLDVRNDHNSILTTLDASNNSSLSCIQVDDEIKANNGTYPYNLWVKDSGTSYSANCSLSGIRIYVPDDRFEQILIDNGWDSAPLDDYVNASVISYVTALNVNSEYIQDLTGIEGFTNLVSLNCCNNLLSSLDVSQNTRLNSLICYTNQLSSLDLSNNTELISLNCTNNLLERLDMSANPELTYLDCQNNQIDSINIKSNNKLDYLSCRKNLLLRLDLSNNDKLQSLDCSDNNLTKLDVQNKTSLTYLDCSQNQLTDLRVSGTIIRNLKCHYNQLSTLDLSTNNNILRLECNSNQLTALDLSQKTDLWLIICNDNQIASLDLSDNTSLVDFVCHHNLLTELDMTNNTLLGSINCSYNQINTPLDLSSCPDLLSANVSNNPVEEIILPGEAKSKANNKLDNLNISYTLITSINILNNTDLNNLNVQGIPLDSLDVSGNAGLSYLNTTGTNLVCIQVNQDQLNNIPAGWTKDAITVYSTDCKATTAIEDPAFTESICIYPNPAGEIVYIESPFRIEKVEILSVTGMKLMEINNDCKAIPIEYLTPGIYILKIESGPSYAIKKFSKK
ncbi:MAG: T9SS type A sorting domain-containing protein [Marinilabiliaceae bacterium]|jgi:Leucine-rich repeat (LRR) protein|nr:T9SS type A sorting domain-containing protein [Marinilabiliaceae bacterium]